MKQQKSRVVDCYYIWKSKGLKRRLNEELAGQFGISVQTLYSWAKKPIILNGVKYDNWEDAYSKETEVYRENFRKEIEAQLENDYRLSDILANEIIMKYIIKVKKSDYIPTLDELKLAVGIQDRKRESMSKAGENSSKDDDKSVGFTIGFRSDKVGKD